MRQDGRLTESFFLPCSVTEKLGYLDEMFQLGVQSQAVASNIGVLGVSLSSLQPKAQEPAHTGFLDHRTNLVQGHSGLMSHVARLACLKSDRHDPHTEPLWMGFHCGDWRRNPCRSAAILPSSITRKAVMGRGGTRLQQEEERWHLLQHPSHHPATQRERWCKPILSLKELYLPHHHRMFSPSSKTGLCFPPLEMRRPAVWAY